MLYTGGPKRLPNVIYNNIIRKKGPQGNKNSKINYDKKTVPYIVHTRETNKIEIKNV